jgi:hypothetical protein
MLYRNLMGALVTAALLTAAGPVRAFDDAKYPDFSGQSAFRA